MEEISVIKLKGPKRVAAELSLNLSVRVPRVCAATVDVKES